MHHFTQSFYYIVQIFDYQQLSRKYSFTYMSSIFTKCFFTPVIALIRE